MRRLDQQLEQPQVPLRPHRLEEAHTRAQRVAAHLLDHGVAGGAVALRQPADAGQQPGDEHIGVAHLAELAADPAQLVAQPVAPLAGHQRSEGAQVGAQPAHGHPRLVHRLRVVAEPDAGVVPDQPDRRGGDGPPHHLRGSGVPSHVVDRDLRRPGDARRPGQGRTRLAPGRLPRRQRRSTGERGDEVQGRAGDGVVVAGDAVATAGVAALLVGEVDRPTLSVLMGAAAAPAGQAQVGGVPQHRGRRSLLQRTNQHLLHVPEPLVSKGDSYNIS